MEGANERCSQMLVERAKPPLMLYLIWAEYTRLAKEVASAAFFGAPIDRAIDRRCLALEQKFTGRPAELALALDELSETMAGFEGARDPEELSANP